MCWPDSLRELSFSVHVGTLFEDASWHEIDRELYGALSDFNQPITEVRWPPSLLKVTFGESFDQLILGVAWPASLRELVFGRDFRLPDASFEWPTLLKKVTIARRPNEPLPSWPGVQVSGTWMTHWDSS